MAALYEAYTLCGLVPAHNYADSGIHGIEPDRDEDRVIVTDCTRSVTVYQVSDQKPLGSWTVKQGQRVSCPAVYNAQTSEYVVVTDEKVIRVWKDEEVSLDQAFKATVTAEIYRVHAGPELEPVVLFRHGAVRLLDSLLAAPQQSVEEVLSQDEVIRWSTVVRTEQQLLLFSTEQKDQHFLYVQRFSPNVLTKHRMETDPGAPAPISYAASFRNGNIHLLFLVRSGGVYESVLTARPVVLAQEDIQALPRTLLLQLPAGDGELSCASLLPLDQAHVAVVGVPHPSAGTGKDFLCLWNTHFQTLQGARELSGRTYGQMWRYSGRLLVCHGKSLSVIPFDCQTSSLAAAVGKLKQTGANESKGPALVPSWNELLHGGATQTHTQGKSRGLSTRKTKTSTKKQASVLTVEQLVEDIKVCTEQEAEKRVQELVSGAEQDVLHLSAGRLARELVARCQAEPGFYPRAALLQLVHTHYLCHSVCPDLLTLALEKRDFRLCQVCLQLFPDIPEAVTCAYLQTVLSVPDAELEGVVLEADSVQLMKALSQSADSAGATPNGVCFLPPADEESCDALGSNPPPTEPLSLDTSCPVGLHKGALLSDVLQTAYTDSLLLPHLKDLSVSQVILLLQYLRFMYLKYSQDAHAQIRALRMPAINQVLDWVCLLLDAHFTVLALAPEAKRLLSGLDKFVRSQMKLYAELGKMEGSLDALKQFKPSQELGLYSIELVELF